jgi:hypothetical protein
MTTGVREHFLDEAAHGRLALQVCTNCGNRQAPPRYACAVCGHATFDAATAGGLGRVASFVVLHRAPDGRAVPYVYAIVELDEGPPIVTNVAVSDPGDVTVGMRVEATFVGRDDGSTWPVFRPVAGDD